MNSSFDNTISREGTHAEKYEARMRLFQNTDAEPFWVADMDLPTPPFLVEALEKRVAHPIYGYTELDAGQFPSIQWWMKNEHFLNVDRAWIRMSPSVVTSMNMAIQCMSNKGDNVVLMSPVYGPFFSSTTNNDRVVLDVPLINRTSRYEVDFGALERALQHPRTSMMLLCNPHNPGGHVFTKSELEQIVSLCTANNVKIFCDEIHCDIVFSPNRHVPLLSIEGAREISIIGLSIGKAFNTSGLQASFALIPDETIRKSFSKYQSRAHCGDINLLGKIALKTALSPQGVLYKKELVNYLYNNTRQVCERLGSVSNLPVMTPEATYLVWVDFRHFGSPAKVMHRLLTEAKILLSGGGFFGPTGEGFFRINCAHPAPKLFPAVDRIVEMLESKSMP